MKKMNMIRAAAVATIAALVLPVSAMAATLPPFCAAQVGGAGVAGGDLKQLVSGTEVVLECTLRYEPGAPNWIVLSTEGSPSVWNLQRLDAFGAVVSEATYSSPEVLVPAATYRVRLETMAPSVVEVLTRPSGLREEVARTQTKSLLAAEVRNAPNGTSVLTPQVEDLTRRVSTLADVRVTVAHPAFAPALASLQKARTVVAELTAAHGQDWVLYESLARDLSRTEQAFEAGQLDRVDELAKLVQGYAVEGAASAQRIEALDSGRKTALRLAVIAGGVALILIGLAGGAIFLYVKRHSLLSAEDSLELAY